MKKEAIQFTQKMVMAVIGVTFVLLGYLLKLESSPILLTAGISLISLAFGIQLLNEVPHMIIDVVKYYRKPNSETEIDEAVEKQPCEDEEEQPIGDKIRSFINEVLEDVDPTTDEELHDNTTELTDHETVV